MARFRPWFVADQRFVVDHEWGLYECNRKGEDREEVEILRHYGRDILVQIAKDHNEAHELRKKMRSLKRQVEKAAL